LSFGSNVKLDFKELVCLLGKKLLLEVVNHTRGTTISPRSKLQATPFQVGCHIKKSTNLTREVHSKSIQQSCGLGLFKKEKLYLKISKQEVKTTRKQKVETRKKKT
jgi:hypothetical protein